MITEAPLSLGEGLAVVAGSLAIGSLWAYLIDRWLKRGAKRSCDEGCASGLLWPEVGCTQDGKPVQFFVNDRGFCSWECVNEYRSSDSDG